MSSFAQRMCAVVAAVGAACTVMLAVNRGYGAGLAVGVVALGALVVACHAVLLRDAERDARTLAHAQARVAGLDCEAARLRDELAQSRGEVARLRDELAHRTREVAHLCSLNRTVLAVAKQGLGHGASQQPE